MTIGWTCPNCGQYENPNSAPHVCPYPFGKPNFISATNPITVQTFQVEIDGTRLSLEQRLADLEARVASLERQMGQP